MPQPVSTQDAPKTTTLGMMGSRGPLMGLADCFMELFGYVHTLRQNAAARQPSYDVVRADVLRLLKQSEAFPTKNGCTWEEYDAARYALCAWIDERILAAGWEHAGRWRAEPLQLVYYGSADAGEKFFERLKQMGAQQNAVREVYFLCLALGFEGRHGGPDGSATLHQLKTQNLRLLFDGATDTPTVASLENGRLFPDAVSHSPAALPARPSTRGSLWVTHLIVWSSSVLLIILYVIYRLSLHSLGSNILRAVGTK
jgi:type VI secretion system protein ImpK